MKKALMPLVVSLGIWIAVLALGFGMLSGCGGCSTANQTAYRATGAAVVTVDAAMKAWGDYVSKNHPGAATEQKVADAYTKYQASVSLLADAAAAYKKMKDANDPKLPTMQANLNAVVAGSAAALADLEQIIASFGVKL